MPAIHVEQRASDPSCLFRGQEYHRWRDSYTLEMAHTPFVTHLNFSFTRYQDLDWLREHATIPR